MASSGAKIPTLNSPTSEEETTTVPQWKKELIQRRKNLAKTIGTSMSNIVYDLGACPITPNNSSTGAIHKGHSHSTNYAHTSSFVEEKPTTKVKSSTKTADFNSFVEAETPFTSSSSQLHSNDGRDNIDSPTKYDKNCDIIKECDSTNKDNLINSKNRLHLNCEKMVAATEEFPCGLEEAEELKYGPGIVSKLRCRYLSLALRQANAKQRPSINNLRRATSLNNLLDDDTIDECDVKDNKAKTPDEYIPAFQKNNQINNRSRQQDKKNEYNRYKQRGNESLKRARSVEALTRYNHHGKENNFNHDNVIILDEITTNGHHHHHQQQQIVVECVTIEDKIIHGREKGDPKPKRLMSYIDADERPPPDLVKQTLKMFEASANRRPISRQNGGEVAAKVATYKSIISQEKPAIIHPKPPLSPKKPNIKPRTTSPKPTICNNNIMEKSKYTLNKEKPVLPKLDINIIKNNLDKKAPTKTNDVNLLRQRPASPLSIRVDYRVNNTNNVNKFDSPIQSPLSGSLSPNITSPYRTSSLLTNNRPESPRKHIIIPQSTAIESPTILQLTSKLNNLNLSPNKAITTSSNIEEKLHHLEDPSDSDSSVDHEEYNVNSINDDDIIDEIDDLSDDNLTNTKKSQKSSMENISKVGYTAQFNFSKTAKLNGNSKNSDDNNSSSSTSSSPITVPASGNAAANTTTVNKPIPLNRDKLQLITNIKSSAVSNNNNINNNNNCKLVNNSDNNSEKCNLTIREIEKNQINKEKSSCEDNIDFLAKWGTNNTCPNGNNSNILNKKKVKPPPQPPATETNSMIFNFSDRKDVPDYIENDGLILRRKRELPKPGESGFVVLGDLTLDSSTSDPEDPWALGPPSPCDVEFANANVVIDGKSSIRQKAKEMKQFKIQFDDTLTATFEYPSETSLLDTNGYDDVDANTAYCPEYSSTFADNLLSHTNKLLSSMPLGSAPFASYTPVKAPIDTPFELGVTTAYSETASNSSSSKDDHAETEKTSENNSPTNGDDEKDEDVVTASNGCNDTAANDNNIESLQYLKPASEEQIINWSQGTRVTDLLF